MNAYPMIAPPSDARLVPIVDAEFDRFEMKDDFEMLLREAEPANFYHHALSEEE